MRAVSAALAASVFWLTTFWAISPREPSSTTGPFHPSQDLRSVQNVSTGPLNDSVGNNGFDASLRWHLDPTPRRRTHPLSSRTCVGSSFETRSCVFRDVCLDATEDPSTPLRPLYFFLPETDADAQHATLNLSVPFSIFINENPPLPSPGFTVTYVNSSRWSRLSDSTWIERPVFALKSKWSGNFGHAMHDHVVPTFAVLVNLGVYDPRTQVVMFDETSTQSARNLFSLIFDPNVTTWREIVTSHPTANGLVCFRQLTVGLGNGHAYEQGQNGRSFLWWLFRSAALSRAGLSPLRQPSRHHIVILQKMRKRYFYNMNRMEEHLRQTFPDVLITVIRRIDRMSIREQMKLMQSATVLITAFGGASFSGVFLPRGARLIMFTHVVDDPIMVERFRPDHDAFTLWHWLSWITTELYTVTTTSGDIFNLNSSLYATPSKLIRDSPAFNPIYHVKLHKLTNMVRRALSESTLQGVLEQR
eukprot:TRINITY_DN10664_c0_g2_i1.p1 TRINITY_DN10664_c0_g2~~TRINITY_DN10664_c0_g2_i1.p1  ORF type:complete len:474 (+),score=25.71 TRINITY_DN10664_c0_g2_i1:196-1617(+)